MVTQVGMCCVPHEYIQCMSWGDVGFGGTGSSGVTDGQTDCICEEGKENKQKQK